MENNNNNTATAKKKVYASGEDYLEAILVLGNKQFGAVRSIDVAHELKVSKPSVSNAMKILKNGGYILIDENGFITLTDDGREIAESIYEKHRVLTTWLEYLGVNPSTAAEDACKIEHVISKESFDKLKVHLSDVHGIKGITE
ncbi:MAG: metal-dependent transcriptional regulator [Ruminococcus sp.]|nr:metal-dependent transcriptional regulator [Ruminococcus sp.]